MGGYGSGPYGFLGETSKTTVEECLNLDIRRLHRDGHLKPGAYLTWAWERGEENKATIGIKVKKQAVRLEYTVTRPDGEKKDYNYSVSISRTSCNFGGERPWFICPGVVNNVVCNRRVAKLYKPPGGDLFLCRHCYNLNYSSSQESGDEMARMRRKLRKLYRKLDSKWEGMAYSYTPEKPKHMHWDTYREITNEINLLERELVKEFERKAAKLIGGFNR
jgi:hypothetical protein